ncbi:MAG: 4Fe-4S binding protein, partial [Magnetococcales bacterium]|nr:4Fe-4S binding protein [Magnetococcales bacterium]
MAPALHDHHDHAEAVPAANMTPAPEAGHDHAASEGHSPALHDHAEAAPAANMTPAPEAGHDHAAPEGHSPALHDHAEAAPAANMTPAPEAGHNHAAPTMATTPAASDSHGGHTHAAPVLDEATGHDGHATGHGTAEGGAGQTMTHPGLPSRWILPALGLMLLISGWGVRATAPTLKPLSTWNLANTPLLSPVIRLLTTSPWPLVTLKMVSVAFFLLVVVAGLFGSEIPERNLATVFVWNYWWPVVVVSVFFMGSAWCAICPWDNIASWLVRHRLWKRRLPHPGLNLKVPLALRTVYPALILFMGLTWLELGVGVTSKPQLTAQLALVMVLLSLLSLLVFERKAFCRYFCPVGRTIGCYSRLAPIEVRPKEESICTTCKTMECYNGSAEIEPCPTHLTVGRFSQNTYCISCGNCVLSCPHQNVSWRLRPMGSEAKSQARPLWDASWFMLFLLGITSFHGVTMMAFWNDWIFAVARMIGESGQLIISFTILMIGGFTVPIVFYALAIAASRHYAPAGTRFGRLFLGLAFCALPLAFVYHLAHNMEHLVREGGDLVALIFNLFGQGAAPLGEMERHARMSASFIPQESLFAIQAGLMVIGFWLSIQIMRHRGV